MSKQEFIEFDSKILSSSIIACPLELKRGGYEDKDVRNLIKGEYTGFEFPIIYKQDDGKSWTDILDTGWPSRYLISTRMKDILEEYGFSGWKSYPIKLYDKKSNEILGYHGFSVTGKCARIDYKKSEIIEKQYVPNGPICRLYKGVVLDEWDGSDFFCPEKSIGIYVTQNVGKVLKENKITNLRLADITKKEIDVKFVKG